MYKIILSIILFFSFLFFSVQQVSAKKIAFIVAISDYKFGVGLNTSKDVELIKHTLLQRGFLDENITILEGKQVTKKNLISAFKKELTDKSEPGDIVVFHFSGHGQQVMDTDGDEADGYDEALVMYPARLFWGEKGYKGEEHFLDDELNELLVPLRKKIGKEGSVLVMVDACFSGTISRGNEKIRGQNFALAPADYKPKIKPGVDYSTGLENPSELKNSAPLIVFSASEQDQFNYETKTENGEPVGSLSYAFSKSLNNNSNIETYRGLFDQMKRIMSVTVSDQTPVAEGNLDLTLFGSENIERDKYFKVKEIKENSIILNAGKLASIYEGTILGLYPVDTRKNNRLNLIAKAEVVESGDFEAKILLDKDIKKEQVLNSWLYIDQQSYGSMKVNVYIDSPKKGWNKIKRIIEKHPVIRIVDEDRIQTADIIMRDSIGKYGEVLIHYSIKNDNNTYIDTLQEFFPKDVSETIIDEIISYSKARYLRQLDLSNSDLNISLELLPVSKYKRTETGYIATEYGKADEKRINGQTIYKENELFIFKIENKGSKDAFFQILNIQPNNYVTVLIPEKGTNEKDIKIEAGQTVIFESKIMQITHPFGNDIFKLIASRKPLYRFREIIENIKGARNPRSPFEFLVKDICSGTRMGRPLSVKDDAASTYDLVIRTVEDTNN